MSESAIMSQLRMAAYGSSVREAGLNEGRQACLTLPNCQSKTAFTACFAARLLEVCLRPENGALHPRRSSFRIIFLSDCVRLQRGLRTLAGPALPASAQPGGMKNP